MDRHSDGNSREQKTPDGILVQRSISGDRRAFEELAGRYRPLLEGCVARWCPDPHLVPDLVQGGSLQLYLCLPTLRVERSLKTWLAQVAYNRCVNEYRRTRPLPLSPCASASGEEALDLLATLPDPDPSPEELAEQQEWRNEVIQTIRALPARQRRLVWLRYTDQSSFAEIGRRLHMPADTAKTSFAHARPALRRLLTEETSLGRT